MKRASGLGLDADARERLRVETIADMRAQNLLRPIHIEYIEKQEPHLDPSIAAMLDRLSIPKSHYNEIDQSSDPAHSTRTLRSQDNMIGPDHGFHTENIQNAIAYELARFEVQAGNWGLIKLINTWVELVEPPEGQVYDPAFGSGTPFDPRILWRNDILVRFLLRITPAWPAYIGKAALILPQAFIPGRAPWELGSWDDGRFDFGMPNGVFIPIPPQHYCHLFALVMQGADSIQALGGRLQGYTQPVRSPEAVKNSTMGWNW